MMGFGKPGIPANIERTSRVLQALCGDLMNKLDIDDVQLVILSLAGSRVAVNPILLRLLIGGRDSILAESASVESDDLLSLLDAEVESATAGSALFGFRSTWHSARETSDVKSERDDLLESICANDLSTFGRLLGARDPRHIVVKANFPQSMTRLTSECSLLDIAVSAGALDITKSLLEFHNVTPSRETLKMAIATGSLELIRMILVRLPDAESHRADLMEVAADFHWLEPLVWLFRSATELEREILAEFALEHRLADALLAVSTEVGLSLWSWRARLLVGAWPIARCFEIVRAPAGHSESAGWCLGRDGVAAVVDPLVGQASREWFDAIIHERKQTLVAVTLPSGVTAIGCSTFSNWCDLQQIRIPPGVTAFDSGAFQGVGWLTSITIPDGLRSIGKRTFGECFSLVKIVIPEGPTDLSESMFELCLSLQFVTLPTTLTSIGWGAFSGCAALKSLVIPPHVTTIASGAFCGCMALRKLVIPASVRHIQDRCFTGCLSLVDFRVGDVENWGKLLFVYVQLQRLVLTGRRQDLLPVDQLIACLTADAEVFSTGLELPGFRSLDLSQMVAEVKPPPIMITIDTTSAPPRCPVCGEPMGCGYLGKYQSAICDRCGGRAMFGSSMYMCRPCNFDICGRCAPARARDHDRGLDGWTGYE
jgi:hypothetical protein